MLDKWLQPAFSEFSRAFFAGRLPGSVAIAGAFDAGAASLALECAKLYLCESPEQGRPCCRCQNCRSFELGSQPDFLGILSASSVDSESDLTHDPRVLAQNSEDDRASVHIAALRALPDWLNLNGISGRKVAVIANAHLMQEQAANALLKIFEEPPASTLIILQTRSFSDLLPTILSRAFKINVAMCKSSDALEFLKGTSVAEDDSLREAVGDEKLLQVALALSSNAPYGALKMLKDGTAKACSEALAAISSGLADKACLSEAVNSLLKIDGRHRMILLGEFLRELLKYKARVDSASLPLLSGLKLEVLGNIRAEKIFDAYSQLKYIQDQPPLIPSRAPVSMMYSWLAGLTEKNS